MRMIVTFVGLIFVGIAAFMALSMQNQVETVTNLAICGHSQPNTSDKTCIVDGDTLWLAGVNLRLKDYDTPESRTNICGSFTEIDLANAATDRLQDLLNGNQWEIETFGMDGTGKRRLATIRIEGEDVGDILIHEGLARRWPDGPEFWCN
jgi:micrococcal nuclease